MTEQNNDQDIELGPRKWILIVLWQLKSVNITDTEKSKSFSFVV